MTLAIEAMLSNQRISGQVPNPSIYLNNGKAIRRSVFASKLRNYLSFCGLDSMRYKSHSSRIGRVALCAARGHPEAYIYSFGKWYSARFRKYIKL